MQKKNNLQKIDREKWTTGEQSSFCLNFVFPGINQPYISPIIMICMNLSSYSECNLLFSKKIKHGWLNLIKEKNIKSVWGNHSVSVQGEEKLDQKECDNLTVWMPGLSVRL